MTKVTNWLNSIKLELLKSAETNKCPSCGKQMLQKTPYCPFCGKSVD
jgi:uncharacterized OB-fold protein